MQRRQFIAGLGSAVAWPLLARAQQPKRRIEVLMSFEEANRSVITELPGDGRNPRGELAAIVRLAESAPK
jgi:hypothetical protein